MRRLWHSRNTKSIRRGSTMLWTLLSLASFTLITNSTVMMVFHHGALTQHFTGQAQAFWSAEYGAAEGIGWLLRADPLPATAVTPLTDEVVEAQGTFTVTITPGASYYTVESVGRSIVGGIQRRVTRAVRIVPPSVREVDVSLRLGAPNALPASGTTSDYAYYGWQQWGLSPYHVVWNPWRQADFDAPPLSPTRALFIRLGSPLAPGDYSVDIEAQYTPCSQDSKQCPGAQHEESMTVYIGGVNQDVKDPEYQSTETFWWYHNVGNCSGVINCGEGNFHIPASQPSPIYLDHNLDGIDDDLNGDGDPDDIRGLIVFVPRNAYEDPNVDAYMSAADQSAGSLHIANIRIRQVDTTARSVEFLGWRSGL